MIEIAVKHQTLSNLKGFCPKEHRKNQRKCPTFLLKEFEKNLFFVCGEEFWNSVSFNLLHTYYYFIYLPGWDLIWTHSHWILFRHSNQLSYQAMKLILRANFVQPLQFHCLFSASFAISFCLEFHRPLPNLWTRYSLFQVNKYKKTQLLLALDFSLNLLRKNTASTVPFPGTNP